MLAALLAIGLIFAGANVLFNMPNFVAQLNTRVESPKEYKFGNYDQILKKYVSKGLVDYESLKKSGGVDAAYIELHAISPSQLSSNKAKLAFWINAYNLISLKMLLDHYPMKQVIELGQAKGFQEHLVGGKGYTLKQISEEVLPPLLETVDWRGIFLICDGSLGGPDLGSHAYQLDQLDNDLAAACKSYVSSPAHYRASADTATLSISPFYRWNRNFIELKYPSPFDLVADYLPTKRLIDVGKINRNYGLEYDWRLNDSKYLDELKKEMEEKKQ